MSNRKHLVPSAECWFRTAHGPDKTKADAILHMENAYNHVENALAATNDELSQLRHENESMRAALVKLRDCDWIITPRDRMDAVRDIARNALTRIGITQ